MLQCNNKPFRIFVVFYSVTMILKSIHCLPGSLWSSFRTRGILLCFGQEDEVCSGVSDTLKFVEFNVGESQRTELQYVRWDWMRQ